MINKIEYPVDSGFYMTWEGSLDETTHVLYRGRQVPLYQMISMTNGDIISYLPEPQEEYAVTHENGKVLELILTDEDGDTYVRENGEWVEVDQDEENPTVFDLDVVFVTPGIVSFYDEQEELLLEDITEFISM